MLRLSRKPGKTIIGAPADLVKNQTKFVQGVPESFLRTTEAGGEETLTQEFLDWKQVSKDYRRTVWVTRRQSSEHILLIKFIHGGIF